MGFPVRIHVMGVWNSSRQTVQEITPVLRARSLGAAEDRLLQAAPGHAPSRAVAPSQP